jgi:amino acid permease
LRLLWLGLLFLPLLLWLLCALWLWCMLLGRGASTLFALMLIGLTLFIAFMLPVHRYRGSQKCDEHDSGRSRHSS